MPRDLSEGPKDQQPVAIPNGYICRTCGKEVENVVDGRCAVCGTKVLSFKRWERRMLIRRLRRELRVGGGYYQKDVLGKWE